MTMSKELDATFGHPRLKSSVPVPSGRRAESARVLKALEDLCEAEGTGSRIPTHTQLMVQFVASERNVLKALDELHRRGRIVRRPGAGTFVAAESDNGAGSVRSFDQAVDTKTIVAIERPDQSFFDRCVELLYKHVEAVNMDLLYSPIRADQDFSQLPLLAKPYGYILFSYMLAPIAKQLLDAGNRVVLIGAPILGVTPEVPCIYGDHEHGGYLAAKHLIQLGHERLGYALSSEHSDLHPRWIGYQRAISEAVKLGKPVRDIRMSTESIKRWVNNPAEAAEYFRDLGSPSGIVAWNDHEAARLMSSVMRAGIKIPEDLSVVGYDSLPEGELIHPQLTTVDSGIHQQLAAAVRLIMQPYPYASNTTFVALPALVVRESTAPPRA